MAIKKEKSTDTTEQKKGRKAIQQRIAAELKKITSQFGQLSEKFEKSLEKDAKKLAKKISKTLKATEPKATEEVTKVKETGAVKEVPIATSKTKETVATKKPATPVTKPSAVKETTENPAAKKSK